MVRGGASDGQENVAHTAGSYKCSIIIVYRTAERDYNTAGQTKQKWDVDVRP